MIYDDDFVEEAKRLIPIDPRYPTQMVEALHRTLDRGDSCVDGVLSALQRQWRLSPETFVESCTDPVLREELLYRAQCAVHAVHLHRRWSQQMARESQPTTTPA